MEPEKAGGMSRLRYRGNPKTSHPISTNNPQITMPFDPTKPMANTPSDASEVREQFNSLKTLIDAQANEIATQAGQIVAQGNQIATLQAALDSVPPGQAVLTLQYAGGSEVPMLLAAPSK